MAIRLVVAVTDDDWFEYLRSRPNLSEINFWAPSGTGFKALAEGELFLFKLKAPRHVIVGGGIYTHSTTLPCSLAWEAFGDANGAATLREMRARIAKYRKAGADDRSDFPIGCRIISQPIFLEERDWIAVPDSWHANIVSFKTYTTENPEGLALWSAIGDRLAGSGGDSPGLAERYGEPQLVRPRLGQGAFRVLVTDIYGRRCAVTQERTLPALEAAHIRPFSDGGEHSPSNGLLLRRDIHSLFDLGYVTVTPDHRFEVSRRIREEYENGRHYYALHGQQVAIPDKSTLQPDRAALAWHCEYRFKG